MTLGANALERPWRAHASDQGIVFSPEGAPHTRFRLRWLPSKAITPQSLPAQQTVRWRYRQVAPGIDLDFYAVGDTYQYDLIVAPHTDVSSARLRIEGADQLSLDRQGRLVAGNSDAQIVFSAPVSYQYDALGQRLFVASRYRLEQGHIGFEVGRYDATRPLIIDPLVVTRSTTVGGSGRDQVAGMAVAADSAVLVAGTTTSSDFIAAPGSTGEAIYVVKIGVDGAIEYARRIGGNGFVNALAIDLDDSGNAYVLGYTDATDLPTPNGFQTTAQGETDAYLIKLDPSGAVVYGSYYGGADFDGQFDGGIAWQNGDRVFITSRTESASGLPLLNPYQSSCAVPPCILLAGFDTGQSGAASLVYASYAGGSGGEAGFELAFDAADRLYVFGFTESASGLIVPGQGFQDSIGSIADRDHYLLKFDLNQSAGQQLVYSTFIGGNGDEAEVGGMHVASDGRVWISGNTTSTNLATAGVLQATLGGATDAYLIAIDSKLSGASSLIWSTYLGADGNETGWDVAAAADGTLWWTFATESAALNPLAPVPELTQVGTPSALQAVAMVANISADGSILKQLTPVAKAAIFLPVTSTIAGSTLHVGASVPELALLANATPPHASGGLEAFLGRFDLHDDRGLTLELLPGHDAIPASGQLTLAYRIHNSGLASHGAIQLSADFPVNAQANSLPPSCTFPGTAFSCTLPDLGAGESHWIYLGLNPVNGTQLDFSASVASNLADLDPSDNTDSASVAVMGTQASPRAPFDLAQLDRAVASADTGELLADSRAGVIVSSQGVDAAAINLLRLGGGLALPIDHIDNSGEVSLGLLDTAQWQPSSSDGLHLKSAANPAHRVFATFTSNGRVQLWSAAPFTAPVAVDQALYDIKSKAPVLLELDRNAGIVRLRQGARLLLARNPFIPGGAVLASTGTDQVVSAGFGVDFLGAAVLGPAAVSQVFADGFE